MGIAIMNFIKKYFESSPTELYETTSRYDSLPPAEETCRVSKLFFLQKMRDIIRLHKKSLPTKEKEKELRGFRNQDLLQR